MKIICFYNVNLDAVHNLNGIHLSELIRRQKLKPKPKMPDQIRNAEDFFSGLLACMKKGTGAELAVENKKTAEFIEQNFGWIYRMGGNAGNMANVLAVLGAEPVVNVPALTPRQASFFHLNVKIPVIRDSNAILTSPAQAAKEDEDLIHFVLQFEAGTKVKISDDAVIAPRENRFIATFDSLNSELYLDPDFEHYCEDHLGEADGLLVSGFHLLTAQSSKSHQAIIDRQIEKIKKWIRRKPCLYVHVELGDFENKKTMRYLVQNLKADSIGMNEDELALLERFHPGWKGILDAASRLQANLNVKRVCVHTREYTVSVTNNLIKPENEIEALSYGADVAAVLVATGQIMRKPDTNGLEVSAIGSDAMADFLKDIKGVKWGRGAYAIRDDRIICLVPSLICERPKVTVGIGDAMTTAAYYREVAAMIEKREE
ncbi:MAG: ADP-dependent glucokinase/phosphofructokinase [Methanotrichaceae archaeon]